MFYKEWSTDTFWLPQTGMSILPTGNSVPTQHPHILRPCFDPEQLGKIESTIRKVGAYLDKVGAASWWKSFLEDARKYWNLPNDNQWKVHIHNPPPRV